MEPIPPQYAVFQIIPKSAEERSDDSFPRNVGEAVMFFNRMRLATSETNCRTSLNKLLYLLARGPDGEYQHYNLHSMTILIDSA